MQYYVGLDVSLKQTSICVVDQTGSVVREGVVNSEQKGVTLASVWTLAASASRQVEFGALLHSGACLSRKAGFTADEQTPKS